jgi:hypothetical protein
MIPKRSMSYLLTAAWIISTAQQARPKVKGHNDPALAQLTTESIREESHSNFITYPKRVIFAVTVGCALSSLRDETPRKLSGVFFFPQKGRSRKLLVLLYNLPQVSRSHGRLRLVFYYI